MAIKLSPEITRQLQASIKRYFAEHLDQDIGDLKAGLVLDYCLKEIGPAVYNRAIADAQAYFQDRIARSGRRVPRGRVHLLGARCPTSGRGSATKPSRFGILTFGRLLASITASSATMPLMFRM